MTNLTTLLIPADLSAPMTSAEVVHDRDGYHLPDLYNLMECQLVETVHCERFPDCLLWCDEEARLHDEPQPNIRASILAGFPIYGTVIVSCYRNGRDLSWTGVASTNPLPFAVQDLQAHAERLDADPAFQAMLDMELHH
jgi:hypothetical protein